jgi:hypothetical protein
MKSGEHRKEGEGDRKKGNDNGGASGLPVVSPIVPTVGPLARPSPEILIILNN